VEKPEKKTDNIEVIQLIKQVYVACYGKVFSKKIIFLLVN
jgi:hypothetical protein